MATDSEKLAAVINVIATRDERRTRDRREGWAEIKAILAGDLPEPEAAEAESDGGGEKSDVVDLSVLTVAELKALAAERDIDLDGVTKKVDIIKAIEAAKADEESEEDDESDED